MVFFCLALIIVVFVRSAKRYNRFSLRAIDTFLLGFALTQCIPYVLYSLGLSETPIYLRDSMVLERGLLLQLISVFEVLMFYHIGGVAKRDYVRRARRPPQAIQSLVRGACWLVNILFAFVACGILINTVQTAASLSNMVLRIQARRLGSMIIISKVQLALLLVAFDDALAVGRCTWQLICAFVLGLPGWILIGQRSALVAPLVLIALNYYNCAASPKAKRVLAITFVVTAGVILGYTLRYKVGAWGNTMQTLFRNIWNRDFDTLWTFSAVLDRVSIADQILPYPGAGYINALLAFLPRRLFPMKGYRDATWFTVWLGAYQGIPLGASTLEEMSWAYKFSYATELMINFGVLGVVALSPCYGLLLAWADRVSRDRRACYAPILWTAFNLWWLDLFSILTGMAFVALVAWLLAKESNEKPYYSCCKKFARPSGIDKSVERTMQN